MVSVYSTEFVANSGFMVRRIIPSTAVIFSEPNSNIQETSTSRQSVYNAVHKSCSRPVFQQGTIVKTSNSFKKWLLHQMVKKLVPPPLKAPAKTAIRRWSNLLSTISTRSSFIKAKAWEQASLACLFPKLRRPFNPIFQQIRCWLGLFEDKFMEVPLYNQISCSESKIEDKEITMERQIPDLKIINLRVRTNDDCFPDKPKAMFGARILIKLVDDLPCTDPRFESSCQELFEQNQVIFTEDCVDSRFETYPF